MAYSEELAERMRGLILERESVSERKMFGGVAWMLNGNMAVGTLGEGMMVRLAPEDAEAAMTEAHVGPMDFTGRPMRGFIKVDSAGIEADSELARWINVGADFAASLPPK